ncbi:MAG: porin [Roseitalea porphyridii]|uniref:porin n=1 Tax=Roseitalea porphyridii TaxID=1852022 RepID=UPI0032D901DE
MKTKSLLLGSAAAMMAVTTANAADVFIPEPEVVEYVRVCEAAGSGFFYIPGTETCLRIGGYVRYDIGFGELNSATHHVSGNETWNKRARASFQVSTWADTELGPLRTFVETRWQYDTNGVTIRTPGNPGAIVTNGYANAGEFSINFAYIDLAGLRIGKDESYFTTFTGYGGAVINDGTAGGYGPFDTNLMSYTFSNGGFSAGISLEQGSNSVSTTWRQTAVDANGDGVLDAVEYATGIGGWGIDDYVPHIVAGAGYDSGAFQVRGVFGYDTRNGTGVGGWAGKIRGDVSFDPFSAFVMLMYGENTSAYTAWANGPATAETFSVIGGASFAVNDQVALNGQVQWAEGNGIGDEWAIAANVNYEPVDGLIVRPEVVYYNNNAGQDSFGGTLRFQRSY